MNEGVAITCQGVSKRFALTETAGAWRPAFGRHKGEVFEALTDISFSVNKGEFVGILGKNGAGKSTLLRVLGGVYSADEGQIVLKGALSGLYELGLAGNPQMTGRAYAERLLTVHGFSKARRQVMIDDALEFSELGERFEDPVLTYSSGMAARLFFSVATAGDYEVYLIDEVLSVGDQHFQSKCWRRLRDRVSKGASGILVTHDWSAIMKLCETTHVIKSGKVDFSGPTEQAVRHYLYGDGDGAKISYTPDIANFSGTPEFPQTLNQGDALKLRFEANLLVNKPLYYVVAIERLQPGFGWEVSMMTRSPTKVASKKGRYSIEVDWPSIALAGGGYRISAGLLTPTQEVPGTYINCDGVSWLNGEKLAFEIEGGQLLHLPTKWSLST